MGEKVATQTTPERVRRWVRLHPDTVQQVEYWRRKRELTEQEYLTEAIEEKIARENADYDLPTLEIKRLNQIIDQMTAMSTNVANLEAVVTTGFDSLLGLTRGDSYLLDAEDGELMVTGDLATAVGD